MNCSKFGSASVSEHKLRVDPNKTSTNNIMYNRVLTGQENEGPLEALARTLSDLGPDDPVPLGTMSGIRRLYFEVII